MAGRQIHPRKAVLLIAQSLHHLLNAQGAEAASVDSRAGHYLRVWLDTGDVCGEWSIPQQPTDRVDEDDVLACIADVRDVRLHKKNGDAGRKPRIGRDELYRQFKGHCDETGKIPKDVKAWVAAQAALKGVKYRRTQLAAIATDLESRYYDGA